MLDWDIAKAGHSRNDELLRIESPTRVDRVGHHAPTGLVWWMRDAAIAEYAKKCFVVGFMVVGMLATNEMEEFVRCVNTFHRSYNFRTCWYARRAFATGTTFSMIVSMQCH